MRSLIEIAVRHQRVNDETIQIFVVVKHCSFKNIKHYGSVSCKGEIGIYLLFRLLLCLLFLFVFTLEVKERTSLFPLLAEFKDFTEPCEREELSRWNNIV